MTEKSGTIRPKYTSGSSWDDIGVSAWSVVSAASAGSDFGNVSYEMIWHSQGLRDGLEKGREAKGN